MFLLWRASSPVIFRAHKWRENCLYFNAWKLLRLNFLNCNYKSRSVEYNCNWSWHHTFHLKKKTFFIFENLLKTSGTTTRISGCLKILLIRIWWLDARYRIEEMIPKRLSNKGVKKSRLKLNPVLALIRLRTTGPWSLNPLEETLLQSVLKSFITVFGPTKPNRQSN